MRALVTGGNSGIGLETAASLAASGYAVTIAARDEARSAAAVATIKARHPAATVDTIRLDLASLASVRAVADVWSGPLDVLVNKAGVMAFPTRRSTEDGFEMQFGVNHLGHFALTARLLPALLAAPEPRVVTVASLAHRRAKLDLTDPQAVHGYVPYTAYSRSKMANLMHAIELDRRARAAGSVLRSIAAHPGWAATGIVGNLGAAGSIKVRAAEALMHLTAQSAGAGARPLIFAATSPDVVSGGYYGPDGIGEMWGRGVKPAVISAAARDAATAASLWALSEVDTGVTLWPAVG